MNGMMEVERGRAIWELGFVAVCYGDEVQTKVMQGKLEATSYTDFRCR